jgi:hypothetical protein
VLALRRPSPPPPPRIDLAALHLDARGPLDFLLEGPGDPLLTTTPRFDDQGD